MDLSGVNSNNNLKNKEHNVQNLTDILSTATFVFDEPELNPVVEIVNR